MNYKVAICDDDNTVTETINEYLLLYSFRYDVTFNVASFNNPADLLDTYTGSGTYNMVFLDVEMPGMTGIELAGHIRNIPDNNVFIIFISSYPEYMKDSFNVQAFQYLTKPISKQAFFMEMNRIHDYISKSDRTQIIVNTAYSESEVIFADDIIYIENSDSKKKHVKIHTTSGHFTDSTGTIREFEDKLSITKYFDMPSRGFLANLKHIHYIKKNAIVMDNGDQLPLSRRNEKKIRDYFNEQLITISGHR